MRIIPAPKSVKMSNGKFIFNAAVGLDCPYPDITASLNGFLQKFCGFTLEEGGGTVVEVKPSADADSEGYVLEIKENQIKITAETQKGAFYGAQSLKQLIAEYYDAGAEKAEIPCAVIEDAPRFKYRGFMFDCARHFFSVDTLKDYIEAISTLKFNVFHWHLTEDQGWRIQIDAYPKLTEVGSKRAQTMSDGKPYGGFYTKDEIRDIVAYAAERYIDVIPEFDMPGHTRAAIAAYPELGCSDTPVGVATKFGIHKEILCGGNNKVYEFINRVLDEMADLFPSKYVHLGGDEAIKTEWYVCPKCQSKIKQLKLHNEEDLQAYMTNEAVKHLKTLGKAAICWNESINSGTLDKSVTIQYWQDGRKAERVCAEIKNGRKTIVSRFSPYYLDYPYAMSTLKAVYDYEPIFEAVKDCGENIIGVESPIWTEWVGDREILDFRVFPRLTAVAETGWSMPENKNYGDFEAALSSTGKILKTLNINQTPLKKCNPPLLLRPLINAKFGLQAFDYDMIVRGKKAYKEMKKMRKLRQGEKDDKQKV